jgi:hypothetical protein
MPNSFQKDCSETSCYFSYLNGLRIFREPQLNRGAWVLGRWCQNCSRNLQESRRWKRGRRSSENTARIASSTAAFLHPVEPDYVTSGGHQCQPRAITLQHDFPPCVRSRLTLFFSSSGRRFDGLQFGCLVASLMVSLGLSRYPTHRRRR